MDYKIELTKKLLESLELATDDKTIRKYLPVFWYNPRRKGNSALKLTEAGFKTLTQKMDVKTHSIRVPKETEWTSQLELRLNKYIDCPYYIDKQIIHVFSEKVAIQLVLFSGDIAKFGLAKARSNAKKTQEAIDKPL
jgi:hypothetical protein